jgi:predicted glycosyltransferase
MSLKLLICTNETLGLGHLRRALRIAGGLHAEIPNLSTLVLTGSAMVHGFRLPAGVDYVKLPSLLKETKLAYTSKCLPLPFEEIKRMREQIILETTLAYQPDLFLVDTRPVGVGGELLPTLRALDKGQRKAVSVMLFRDVLNDPELLRAQWQGVQAMGVLEEMYDEIWVFGCQALFDPVKEYELSDIISKKIRFCGYLGVDRPFPSSEETRHNLGLAGEVFVLVTVGNGRDGFPVLDTYLRALEILPKNQEIFSLLVGGPDLPEGEQQVVRQRCEEMARVQPERPVRFIDFSPQLLEYMAAADLVVSMGGYNTLVEILTLEKRALVVPRVRLNSEQLIRASLFERLGLMRMFHPDHLSPEILAEALLGALHAPAPSRQHLQAAGLDLNGLHQVKTHVLRLLGERGLVPTTSR